MVLIDPSVGEDKHVRPAAIRLVSLEEQPVYCLFEPCVFVVEGRQHGYLEILRVHILYLQKVGRRKYRVFDLKHLAVLGGFLQNIPRRAYVNGR